MSQAESAACCCALIFHPTSRKEWCCPERPSVFRAGCPGLPRARARRSFSPSTSMQRGRTPARRTCPGETAFFLQPWRVAARGIPSARFPSCPIRFPVCRGFPFPPNTAADPANPRGHAATAFRPRPHSAARWNSRPAPAAGIGNTKEKGLSPKRPPGLPAIPRPLSWRCSLRAFFRGTRGKLQPVALINKGNCQQDRSEGDKTQNPVSLFERGHIVDKHLHDRYRYQNQRLPAHKRRPLPESDGHQRRAINQPDRGITEVARNAKLRIIVDVARPRVVVSHPLPVEIVRGFPGQRDQRQQIQGNQGHIQKRLLPLRSVPLAESHNFF